MARWNGTGWGEGRWLGGTGRGGGGGKVTMWNGTGGGGEVTRWNGTGWGG